MLHLADDVPSSDISSARWAELLGAMMHAAWLVQVPGLRILAANAEAGLLCGTSPAALRGRAVLDFAATPEDEAFWQAAMSQDADSLDSEALIRRADDARLVPVTRLVTRLRAEGPGLFLVAFEGRGEQLDREAELEETVASLQATLDSLVDGVLVTDLRGSIRNFNCRFAELWELPDELLVQRRDDAVFDWMRARVIDPSGYMRRLAALDDATLLRASDIVALRDGRVVERMALPQRSRGQPVGRVFTFREVCQVRGSAPPGA